MKKILGSSDSFETFEVKTSDFVNNDDNINCPVTSVVVSVIDEPTVEITDCDPNPGSEKCRKVKVFTDKARPSGHEI